MYDRSGGIVSHHYCKFTNYSLKVFDIPKIYLEANNFTTYYIALNYAKLLSTGLSKLHA